MRVASSWWKLGKNLEKLKNVMLDLALERHFLLWYT